MSCSTSVYMTFVLQRAAEKTWNALQKSQKLLSQQVIKYEELLDESNEEHGFSYERLDPHYDWSTSESFVRKDAGDFCKESASILRSRQNNNSQGQRLQGDYSGIRQRLMSFFLQARRQPYLFSNQIRALFVSLVKELKELDENLHSASIHSQKGSFEGEDRQKVGHLEQEEQRIVHNANKSFIRHKKQNFQAQLEIIHEQSQENSQSHRPNARQGSGEAPVEAEEQLHAQQRPVQHQSTRRAKQAVMMLSRYPGLYRFIRTRLILRLNEPPWMTTLCYHFRVWWVCSNMLECAQTGPQTSQAQLVLGTEVLEQPQGLLKPFEHPPNASGLSRDSAPVPAQAVEPSSSPSKSPPPPHQ